MAGRHVAAIERAEQGAPDVPDVLCGQVGDAQQRLDGDPLMPIHTGSQYGVMRRLLGGMLSVGLLFGVTSDAPQAPQEVKHDQVTQGSHAHLELGPLLGEQPLTTPQLVSAELQERYHQQELERVHERYQEVPLGQIIRVYAQNGPLRFDYEVLNDVGHLKETDQWTYLEMQVPRKDVAYTPVFRKTQLGLSHTRSDSIAQSYTVQLGDSAANQDVLGDGSNASYKVDEKAFPAVGAHADQGRSDYYAFVQEDIMYDAQDNLIPRIVVVQTTEGFFAYATVGQFNEEKSDDPARRQGLVQTGAHNRIFFLVCDADPVTGISTDVTFTEGILVAAWTHTVPEGLDLANPASAGMVRLAQEYDRASAS